MKLTKNTKPAVTTLAGSHSVTLKTGQHLKMRTQPTVKEFLDAVVPAGKVWDVRVDVHVTERDK